MKAKAREEGKGLSWVREMEQSWVAEKVLEWELWLALAWAAACDTPLSQAWQCRFCRCT